MAVLYSSDESESGAACGDHGGTPTRETRTGGAIKIDGEGNFANTLDKKGIV